MNIKPFVLLSLAAVAACSSNDSTGPNTNLSGTLGFTYAGGIAGNFSASGTVDGSSTSDWAWAWRDDSDGSIIIGAQAPRSSTTHDMIGVVIPRVTVGSSTVSANCTSNTCAELVASFGIANTGTGSMLQSCLLTSGTLTIATISNTRVTGSFNGTGQCFTPAGAQSTFTVTNGTFDTALLTAQPN